MGIKAALQSARAKAVALNPVSLILTRTTTTINAKTGGPSVKTSVLAAQDCRLVEPQNGVEPEQISTGGKAAKVEWLVVFEDPAANVEPGDTFTHPITGAACIVLGTRVTGAEGSSAVITALAAEVRA